MISEQLDISWVPKQLMFEKVSLDVASKLEKQRKVIFKSAIRHAVQIGERRTINLIAFFLS